MEQLSNDFKVAVRILDYNKKGEPVWFAKLVEDMKEEVSKVTISKNIDKLFDLGIINGDWEKLSNGKWVRTFQIAGEASSLIESIAEKYPN